MIKTTTQRFFACFLIFLSSIIHLQAQVTAGLWTDIPPGDIRISERSSAPLVYRSLKLDLRAMMTLLNSSLEEKDPSAFINGPVISVPMPDGSFQKFVCATTNVMHPLLAAKYPGIRTFIGHNIEDKTISIRVDYTQWGFHAMIMSPHGWVFIDPAFLGNTENYISYLHSSSVSGSAFICESGFADSNITNQNIFQRSSGSTLRTYDLALACTGEYAAFFGGTVAGALSAMVTSVNRVTGVYESEVSIRLILIAKDDTLIYTDPATDPYTNNNGSTMLGENQTKINSVIGAAGYDIGHVFSTGGGGIAGLGVVCNDSQKARGVTGSGAPVGDDFDIDYVVHEMGHQFAGNHTFNGNGGSCTSNIATSAAYEPGSGTTIMAYAGICGAANNTQPHSDPYFHTKSFDEITIYTTTGTGNTCATISSNGNTPPVVTLGANYTIPYLTPFTLTASATDANGDPLTYMFEEYDLGPQGAPNSPSGNAPIFRDFVPLTIPSRTFPRIEDIIRNTQTLGELLPSYARSLKFRFTARDNRTGGGGVMHDDNTVNLTVINTTDTFKITYPNTAVNFFSNSSATVTWNVASTTASPISCAAVNIYLSLDSGYSFPYTLATNTSNDGTEAVTLPNVSGNKARIKVAAAGNIFFDISDINFTINASGTALTAITNTQTASSSLCAGSGVDITFTTDGPANSNNVFTALLSNSSGIFSPGTSIGSISSPNAGIIHAVIPAATAAGSGYKIKVTSSSPVVSGSATSTLIISSPPGIATSITGNAGVCQGQTGVTYSTTAIVNATSYIWTLPSGATITAGSGTNSITISFSSAAASGNLSVQGYNAGCGAGTAFTKAITVMPLPSTPGAISGSKNICANQQGAVFSIAAVTGATGYVWSASAGATIASGQNTNSIAVNFSSGAQSGTVSVYATNSCGNSGSSVFAYTVFTSVTVPVVVATSQNICAGQSAILSYTQKAKSAYQWRKNSVNISGATAATYSAATAGTYDVVADTIRTFTSNNSVPIPDNSCTPGTDTIEISGYTGTLPSSGITLSLNLTHTYDGDLVLVLQSPNGDILGLANQKGGSGDNFVNTTFNDTATAVLPASGAPYTGTYKPAALFSSSCVASTKATFASVNSGAINPNGKWILKAYDLGAADTGRITKWSLSFPASVAGPCLTISNSVAITVTPVVTPSVTISSSQGTTVCAQSTVIFTATPVNGGSSPSYAWTKNNISVGTNSNTYSDAALATGDVIKCTLTNNDACTTSPTALSNTLTITVTPLATVTSISPVTGIAGTSVQITGTGFAGVTSVKFNGTNASSYTVNNSTLITAVAPTGVTNGPVTVTIPCGTATSTTNFITTGSDTINVKVFLEGMYDNAGLMKPLLSFSFSDTITAELHNTSAPYALATPGIFKAPVSTTGNGVFIFPASALGHSYYLVLKNRNAMQTWSAAPVSFSTSVISYDFTTAANKAYGSNQHPTADGKFTLFSGDVDQNGVINLLDLTLMESGLTTFAGGYNVYDLTGEGQVESADYSLIENNVAKSVTVMKP